MAILHGDLPLSPYWWEPGVAISGNSLTIVACITFHGFYAYFALALWLLAAQEPRLRFVEPAASARRLLRAFAVLVVPAWSISWGGADELIYNVHSIVITVAVGAYLRVLSSRTADPTLGKRTTRVVVGFAVASVFATFVPDILSTRWSDASGSPVIENVFRGVVAVTVVVYYIRYIAMLFEYKGILKRALHEHLGMIQTEE